MDPVLLYYSYLFAKKRNKRRRRWAVHPINQTRYVDGHYRNLYSLLRQDSDKFFNYFRMSTMSFDELVVKVKNYVVGHPNSLRGLNFSIEEMLTVTLRFLGSGCSYHDLHYGFRIGVTTISLIVVYMCTILWQTLSSDVFPVFDEELWRETAEGFKKRAYFPHCLGAIDGKHVRIIKPQHSGSLYYNYKQYFSVVLMAVVDSNYKFMYIDVGAMGKDADPTIFKLSTFGKALGERSLNIPNSEGITPSLIVPFVFVADDAFEMSESLMRPFPGSRLTLEQRVFNYRLSTARRFVECAFGILSNKWRIFHKPLNLKVESSVTVIKTTCVLHNFVRDRDGFRFQDTQEVVGFHDNEPIEEAQWSKSRSNKLAYEYRRRFAEYFCSPEGSVPWRNEKCNL